jgi:sec-independent protein translocase protein TatB
MFDIAFTELMVVGVIALLVIGPERLPKVARTAGQWLGRLNRYVSQVKQDIDRDIKLDELRKMQQEMKDSAQRYEIMAGDVKREVEETVEQETAQISRVMQAMSATDGGLTMQEWDKIKADEAVKAAEVVKADQAKAEDAKVIEVVEAIKEIPVTSTQTPHTNS